MTIIQYCRPEHQTTPTIKVGDKVTERRRDGVYPYTITVTVEAINGATATVNDGLGAYPAPLDELIPAEQAITDTTGFEIGDDVTIDGKPARISGYGASYNARNTHTCGQPTCSRWDIDGEDVKAFAWSCEMTHRVAEVVHLDQRRGPIKPNPDEQHPTWCANRDGITNCGDIHTSTPLEVAVDGGYLTTALVADGDTYRVELTASEGDDGGTIGLNVDRIRKTITTLTMYLEIIDANTRLAEPAATSEYIKRMSADIAADEEGWHPDWDIRETPCNNYHAGQAIEHTSGDGSVIVAPVIVNNAGMIEHTTVQPDGTAAIALLTPDDAGRYAASITSVINTIRTTPVPGALEAVPA